MTALLVCWILFPIAMTAISIGCGLLLEQLANRRMPSGLLPAAGFSVVLVAGHVATAWDGTAEFAVPVVLALAAAGAALSWPLHARGIDWWGAAVGCGVFAVFAAPVLLSGEATFAGYIKLDDTATWLAITDRLMEHGRDLSGLASSSYEATLDVNLRIGYPVGAFPPLGIGAKLVGQDPAWVFQPYQALLAAYTGMALYVLTARVIESRPMRAAVAFVATQPSLLFAYSLWGGVKELAAAWAIALLAALAAPLVADRVTAWSLFPIAFASAALLAVLSFGGVVWLAPVLVPAVLMLARVQGVGTAVAAVAAFVVITAALAVPTLQQAEVFLRPASGSLTSESDLGNLIEPISRLQLFGIWPVGDFRFDPDDLAPTYLLIAVVAVAALGGIAWAAGRRAWELLLYLFASIAGALAISAFGSPWVGAKALATGAPALLLAAGVGVAALMMRGRRAEAAVIGLLIVGGVVWSNALAYHEVNLAPRDRHAELEQIGKEIEGEGPTLMTEYEPYGVRHFLRKGDPEGVSELRRRPIPLRDGRVLDKLEVADVDELALDGLLVYRTLVLRRSPVSSRPPSVYTRVRSGRFYDVWQRPPNSEQSVVQHLSIGDAAHAAGRARCDRVMRIARTARRVNAHLAVARRPAALAAGLPTPARSGWTAVPNVPGGVYPNGDATVTSAITLPRTGSYDAFVAGSYRGKLRVTIGGREVSSRRHELSHAGVYEPLGSVRLPSGRHAIEVEYDKGALPPGGGGIESALGPIVLAPESPQAVERVSPDVAKSLCGRSLDWIEAVAL